MCIRQNVKKGAVGYVVGSPLWFLHPRCTYSRLSLSLTVWIANIWGPGYSQYEAGSSGADWRGEEGCAHVCVVLPRASLSLGAEVGKMIPNKGIPVLLLMQKSSRSLVFTCVCVCVTERVGWMHSWAPSFLLQRINCIWCWVEENFVRWWKCCVVQKYVTMEHLEWV